MTAGLPGWAAAGWDATPEDVDAVATGAGILGTGGGGNPYLGRLRARRVLEEGRRIRVVPLDAVPDAALGCGIGGMGAPTIGLEKLPRGTELAEAVLALARHVGRAGLDWVIPGEIGGANALGPMAVAGELGIPVLDGDGMGRAFPELQMDTFMIHGVSPAPFALADAHHHRVVFDQVTDPRAAERLARAVTIAMGASAALAMPLLDGATVRRTAIPGTLSLARAIGRAVHAARAAGTDPVEAILRVVPGVRLCDAKLTDVERRTVKGFARGRMVLEPLQPPREPVEIAFQNEFLIARQGDRVLATVPDLITLADLETGEPVTTEVLRYGLRVAVLGLPAPRELRTPAALEVVGPAAFGYDVPYEPLPGELLGRA